MADISSLHAEIAELKQLVLGLLAQQDTQQLHPAALHVIQQQQVPQSLLDAVALQQTQAPLFTREAEDSQARADKQQHQAGQDHQTVDRALLVQQAGAVQRSEEQPKDDFERPKPKVQLDLPSDESPAYQAQQLSPPTSQPAGTLPIAPVILSSKLFKPSISDLVMHMRAAQQAQGCTAFESPVPPASENGAAAQVLQQEQQHKQQSVGLNTQQQFLQQDNGAPDVWSIGAAYGKNGASGIRESRDPDLDYNDIDLLSNRVHADMVSRTHSIMLDEAQRPVVQLPWYTVAAQATCSGLKAFFWDILVPQGYMMMIWDLVVLLLIIYLCFVLPYAVAFGVDFSDMTQPLAVIDLTISMLFLVDIWMNFHTSYIGDDGRLVTDRRLIAETYIKGWFAFDLVSSLPWEQLLSLGAGINPMVARIIRVLKVLRLIKLLRLTRVFRMPHVLQKLEAVVGRVLLQLSTLAGSMVLLLHWAACIWYFVATLNEDGRNWVAQKDMKDKTSYMEIYITALYWSVTTIATVGYGDIVGHNITEKIVAMIAMLIGASVFGYFMGAMAVVVSALNSNSARMATKRQAVDEFLRHRRVPRALADKIRSYYNYVVAREVQADEADIIAGLSASLRTQIVLHLYQEALEKVPFFRGQDPQFITSIVTFLKLEYYAPGDIVVRQGDLGSEMYFIGEGILEARIYEDERGSPLAKALYLRSSVKNDNDDDRPDSAATHSRRPSGPAVSCKTAQQPDRDSRTSTLTTSSSLGRLSTALYSAARIARQSRLGRVLAKVSGSSASEDLSRPCGLYAGEAEQLQDPSSKGHKSSTAGLSSGYDTAAASREGARPGSVSLEEPYQLPLHNKKIYEKYTYVDELSSRRYRRIGYLRPGEYFGEYSCLLGEARTATVIATTYCELYSLSRGDLEEVLQQWPELAEEFESMVRDASAAREPIPPSLAATSSPLAMWNAVKSAYQQNAASRGSYSMNFSKPQPSPEPSAAVAAPVQQTVQQVAKADNQPQAAPDAADSRPDRPGLDRGGGLQEWHALQNNLLASNSPRQTRTSSQRADGNVSLAAGHGLIGPRPTLGRVLSDAHAFGDAVESTFNSRNGTSEGGAPVSVAARTAARIRHSLQLDRNQQQLQQWQQSQQQLEQHRMSTTFALLDEGMVESAATAAAAAAAAAAADAVVALAVSTPNGQHYSSSTSDSSLARRSVGLARRSQGLGRSSVPSASLARSSFSLVRRSPADLRRPSAFIPGSGTGLFAANPGGYLFPASVDRTGSLVSQGLNTLPALGSDTPWPAEASYRRSGSRRATSDARNSGQLFDIEHHSGQITSGGNAAVDAAQGVESLDNGRRTQQAQGSNAAAAAAAGMPDAGAQE